MAEFGTFVYRNGELVEKHLAGPLFGKGPRSGLPTPMIISDGTEVRSMGDGKIYTSKSALRRSYKEQGFVELGNDAPRTRGTIAKPDPKADLVEALQKVKQGYKPPPLETKVLPD
jgi:hypothetical protein